ncbi:ATP-binding cassette domain-containing protein [Yinghuangia aomiensis]
MEAGRTRDKSVIDEALDVFPRLTPLLKRRAGFLSGGQQQQLAIARALVTRPRLLILDEPTEGIQPSIVAEIEDAIERLHRERGLAVLLVEQYLDFATRLADRFTVLDAGVVVHEGAGAELHDERVRGLLAVRRRRTGPRRGVRVRRHARGLPQAAVGHADEESDRRRAQRDHQDEAFDRGRRDHLPGESGEHSGEAGPRTEHVGAREERAHDRDHGEHEGQGREGVLLRVRLVVVHAVDSGEVEGGQRAAAQRLSHHAPPGAAPGRSGSGTGPAVAAGGLGYGRFVRDFPPTGCNASAPDFNT